MSARGPDVPPLAQTATPPGSEEFYIKVNDFIEAANRIERRLDTHHAVMVMLHAFSRYSAHHYLSTTKADDQAGREAFAAYIARGVEELIVGHVEHLAGPPPAGANAAEGQPADAAGAEPSKE
jgi:hypothetical protein